MRPCFVIDRENPGSLENSKLQAFVASPDSIAYSFIANIAIHSSIVLEKLDKLEQLNASGCFCFAISAQIVKVILAFTAGEPAHSKQTSHNPGINSWQTCDLQG